MHYNNETHFAKASKGRKPQGLYLLYGEEAFLIESWAKRLAKSFGGDQPSFNFQRLDGRRLDCNDLYNAVETLPLMAQDKCVLVDDLDLQAMTGGDLDTLLEILQDLPPACTLILTAKPPAFNPKSAAGKKLIKACGDAGNAVHLQGRSPADLVQFLRRTAKKHGCDLSPDLARYMLELCGSDMHTLGNETAKICAYAGGGTLTRQHIDAVATVHTEARVFDLSKCLLAGNVQRAMEILDDLFFLRESPLAILSVLSLSYADLYRARVARDSGKTPADVIAAFPYKGREFRVKNAWNSRLSRPVLRRCIETLLDCDRRMKSTGVDSKILLEQTVIRLFQLGGSH